MPLLAAWLRRLMRQGSAESVPTLRICHNTRYRYRRPVALGPHRLMLRPRENCDVHLRASQLAITPQATVTWAQDVFGNTVATASFTQETDTLDIRSQVEVELLAHPWPVFDIAASAQSYPFRYSDEEWTDLGALASEQYEDPAGRLRRWAQDFVYGPATDTLSLLKDLSTGISTQIWYQSRDDEGAQTPLQTLDRGWGACRDVAVLLAEAARSLGFGARIVSGYLHNPNGGLAGTPSSGATHAWVEIYLPGAGWIAFDPTNRSVGGANLIPVAVVRRMAQAVPVSGSFLGMTDAFIGMDVDVTVALA